MKSKRIGVLCWKSQETGSISIAAAYAAYFTYFGSLVPIFALDEHINTDIDLLVLPGGADVYPSRYGGKPNFETQNPNIQAEYFDVNILPQYIDAGIPIFGICRGFQTLNVHFGGTLSQHIVQKSSTASRHEQTNSLIATNKGIEYLKINNICNLKANSTGNVPFKVNSLHHQGVFQQNLAANIETLLINADDKNVEAFAVEGLPIIAVQWHPEELRDSFSTISIRKLITQSKRQQ